VKFIVDPTGARPSGGSLGTDDQVRAQSDLANRELNRLGRGYRFSVVELLDLPNVSAVTNFFNNNPNDKATAIAIERAAEADKALFRYRDDAINVYINGHASTAVCSLPGSASDADDIILAGQGSFLTTLFHECGHYFSLYHTQGRNCNGCGTGKSECNTPGDDEIADTLPDLACWDRDQIATNAFPGVKYDSLKAFQKVQVDMTWSNVMSYHIETRMGFTEDQADRVTDISNTTRNKVATGFTYCVAPWGEDGPFISGLFSTRRYRTVARALEVAGGGDVILIAGGNYPERLTIKQATTLRATRGPVTLGTP